jgi:P pilus assembly chaperone PapD
MVSPQRVDLNNANKIQSVKLVNTTDEEVTYSVSFMYQKMTESGKYEDFTESELQNLSNIEKVVMFSPKRVILAPKQTQTVRFALRRKEDIKNFEYNAHILFKEIAKKETIMDLNKRNSDGSIGMKVIPLFNTAIPIKVSDNSGKVQYQAEISNINLNKENNVVSFVLTNKGNKSPLGNVVVTFLNANGKKINTVQVNDMAIPMPLMLRNIDISYDDTKFDENMINNVTVEYFSSIDDKPYTISSGSLQK